MARHSSGRKGARRASKSRGAHPRHLIHALRLGAHPRHLIHARRGAHPRHLIYARHCRRWTGAACLSTSMEFWQISTAAFCARPGGSLISSRPVTCGASCSLQGLPFSKGLGGRRTAGRSFGTTLRLLHPLSSLDCPGAPGLSPKSGSGARGSSARPSRCTAVRARTRKTTPRAVCVLRNGNRCSSTTDCPTVTSGRKPAALLYTIRVWRQRFVNFATWGIASRRLKVRMRRHVTADRGGNGEVSSRRWIHFI